MAKLLNGYEAMKVELLESPGNNIAELVYEFSKLFEFSYYKDIPYDKDNPVCIEFVRKIWRKLYPKYLYGGLRVSFRVHNISRICLAQFTREKGLFMSTSHGAQPLSQELVIPKAMYENKDWMQRYEKICYDLEELYIDMAEAGIPYMDARYIMPHAQTISLTYCATLGEFIHSCKSRIRHGFADEINMLYRLMRKELIKVMRSCTDENSKELWEFLLEQCKDKEPYLREGTYNNDWQLVPDPEGYKFTEPAYNDWRKSSWRKELQEMYDNKVPDMLDPLDIKMIEGWKGKSEDELYTTYDENYCHTLIQSIKTTDYYKEHRK